MQTFTIEVKETLSKTITIAANSAEEAIAQVEEWYRQEEIVLSADDFEATAIEMVS